MALSDWTQVQRTGDIGLTATEAYAGSQSLQFADSSSDPIIINDKSQNDAPTVGAVKSAWMVGYDGYGQMPGIVARYQNVDNYYAIGIDVSDTGPQLRLGIMENGAFTQLTTSSIETNNSAFPVGNNNWHVHKWEFWENANGDFSARLLESGSAISGIVTHTGASKFSGGAIGIARLASAFGENGRTAHWDESEVYY